MEPPGQTSTDGGGALKAIDLAEERLAKLREAKESIEKSYDGNDKNELVPTVNSVPEEVREIREVCADAGYHNQKAIEEIEQRGVDENGKETQEGPTVYSPPKRQAHHPTVADLEKKPESQKPPENAPFSAEMSYRLQTPESKAAYKKRKETVESVFGIIKQVIGFRQFSLRGLAKASIEWDIVKLAYNFKRLHRLSAAYA
ncbi:hypothetical protein AGMMS4952_04850 [Spirochaetia bacterium]|nr:hypothetical protein AGMMS4952_04850 [Spirochaetia bacterium]